MSRDVTDTSASGLAHDVTFRTLRSSSDEKNLSCARWRLKGFGYGGPFVYNSE